jgi:hypothetical protein
MSWVPDLQRMGWGAQPNPTETEAQEAPTESIDKDEVKVVHVTHSAPTHSIHFLTPVVGYCLFLFKYK